MTTTIQKLKQKIHKPLTTKETLTLKLLIYGKYTPQQVRKILKTYRK